MLYRVENERGDGELLERTREADLLLRLVFGGRL